jgi:hypothetical protein
MSRAGPARVVGAFDIAPSDTDPSLPGNKLAFTYSECFLAAQAVPERKPGGRTMGS